MHLPKLSNQELTGANPYWFRAPQGKCAHLANKNKCKIQVSSHDKRMWVNLCEGILGKCMATCRSTACNMHLETAIVTTGQLRTNRLQCRWKQEPFSFFNVQFKKTGTWSGLDLALLKQEWLLLLSLEWRRTGFLGSWCIQNQIVHIDPLVHVDTAVCTCLPFWCFESGWWDS